MEILTGLFIVGLYKATEKIWEKGFDAAWEPVGEALKERFTRWAGRDKESQRRVAFLEAAARARRLTVEQARDRETTEAILKALDAGRNQDVAEALAEEGAKLMLFSAHPDVPRLTKLCTETLRWESFWEKERPPQPEAVAAVLSDFLSNLREALLDQEPYHDLVEREMLRALREIVAELRPVAYDDEATYRAQVAKVYRQLEFVGIPELKERRPITVEDIFIRLRAERQIEVIPDWELEEQIEDAEAQRDAHRLIALQAKQRVGSVGRKVTPKERQQWSEELEAAAEARDAKAVVTLQRRLERTAPLVTEVSVEESLKQANRMVILGDPGAGKTTLLKYLTVICAEGRAPKELGLTVGRDGGSPLPIFVPLREFAAECAQREEDYCLLDHLYTCAREHLLLNLPPGFFEEALDDGRGLVCLDGLDEVWTVGQRQNVRDAVKALAARFPRSRYIVTSRIVGYGEAPLDRRDFVHHTILPFEDDDIRQFVRQWYEARERDPVQRQQKADDLIATIEREPRIRNLAQNPLLLTIIALVHRIEAELPHERVKLYDKCVTALVETWEEVKGLSLEEKQRPFYRYRRRLLERLAYELHTQAEEPGQLRTVKEGDLELLLSRFLMENRRLGLADDPDGARDEARAFIHLARGRTGLLVERGEGVFGFPHLTFQEYLAACDIENRCIHRGVDALWEEIKPRLHDPHWREVILLLLGSLNKYDEPPTLLVERILEAGQDDKYEPVLHRHLYLAARALADRVDVADDLHGKIITEVLTVAREGHWAPWISKVFKRDTEEDKLVLEAFGEAADAMGVLCDLKGDIRAVEELLFLALDQQAEVWIRRDAISALSGLGWGDERIIDGVLSVARDLRAESDLRSVAAFALGRLGRAEEKVLESLLALARDEKVDNEVRGGAASALGELGRTEEKVIRGLLRLAQDERVDAWVRHNAAETLAQLGRTEEAGDVLLTLAHDPQVEAWVRHDTAEILRQLGRIREVAEALLALARDEKVDAWERRSAASTLEQLGRAEEAGEILLGLMRDERVYPGVRRDAASALGRLGRAEEATEVLLALARDKKVEDWERSAAASALGRLGPAGEAAEILLALARDEKVDDLVRRDAASALGQLGCADEKVLDGLLALACDEKMAAGVRSGGASALGELGRVEEAEEILLGLMRDERVYPGVRRDAAFALGRLGRAEEATEVLLALARDKKVEDWVRSNAYESLKVLVGMATD